MQNNQNISCITLITGPTGVGKSDLALEYAQRIGGEIINADMGQFYVPLSIGTAKPQWQHESVPHHLFDILKEPQQFTASAYRGCVLSALQEVLSRGKRPVIVGGSGFYLKSLFFPPHAPGQVSAYNGAASTEDLWQRLHDIDPVRARKIHRHDAYRIQRALAIWEETGKLPSYFVPTFEPPAPFHCLIVVRDREELYERINQRVLHMVELGWIDEVKRLQGTAWESFVCSKKIIGYDVMFEYLRGALTKEQMITMIQQKTRNYAKRQLTFFRSFYAALSQALVAYHVQRFHGSVAYLDLSNTSIETAISDSAMH